MRPRAGVILIASMFAERTRTNLIKIATAYGKASGLSLAQVSKRAYGNGVFLKDLKSGQQSISIKKVDDMLLWFSVNWPDGTRWPLVQAVMMSKPPARVRSGEK